MHAASSIKKGKKVRQQTLMYDCKHENGSETETPEPCQSLHNPGSPLQDFHSLQQTSKVKTQTVGKATRERKKASGKGGLSGRCSSKHDTSSPPQSPNDETGTGKDTGTSAIPGWTVAEVRKGLSQMRKRWRMRNERNVYCFSQPLLRGMTAEEFATAFLQGQHLKRCNKGRKPR